MAFVDQWKEDGLAIKAYAIQRNPAPAVPMLSPEVAAAARKTAMAALRKNALDARATGLGFCIVHVGEEAVWLLVDWWISGGILCQQMYSAPLETPAQFKPVQDQRLFGGCAANEQLLRRPQAVPPGAHFLR